LTSIFKGLARRWKSFINQILGSGDLFLRCLHRREEHKPNLLRESHEGHNIFPIDEIKLQTRKRLLKNLLLLQDLHRATHHPELHPNGPGPFLTLPGNQGYNPEETKQPFSGLSKTIKQHFQSNCNIIVHNCLNKKTFLINLLKLILRRHPQIGDPDTNTPEYADRARYGFHFKHISN